MSQNKGRKMTKHLHRPAGGGRERQRYGKRRALALGAILSLASGVVLGAGPAANATDTPEAPVTPVTSPALATPVPSAGPGSKDSGQAAPEKDEMPKIPWINSTSPSGETAEKTLMAAAANTPTDLYMSKEAIWGGTTYVPGSVINYQFDVLNQSSTPSSGFTITDTLPASLTNPTTTSPGCSISGRTLTCIAGHLSAGSWSERVYVKATVAPGTSGNITNTATVRGNEPDPNSANNTSTVVSTRGSLTADLSITKIGPASYIPGRNISYSITVTGQGNSFGVASTGYTLTDILPASLTNPSTSSPGCSIAGRTLTCTGALVDRALSSTVEVTATVASDATGDITNTATVTGSDPETNLADNTSTVVSKYMTPPGSNQALTCGPVYGIGDGSDYPYQRISQIDTATGQLSTKSVFWDVSDDLNGLAMAPNGDAYAYERSSTSMPIYKYDSATLTTSAIGTFPVSGDYAVMGGFDPDSGYYWIGTASDNVVSLYAFDTNTNTNLGLQFKVSSTGGNGDLAFDGAGNMYLVTSSGDGTPTANSLQVVKAPLPTGGQTAPATLLTHLEPLDRTFNGIAFGGDGYLYAGGVSRIYQLDPATGAQISTVVMQNPDGSTTEDNIDLASCTSPNTIELKKNIVGRASPGDQFSLAVTGNGITKNNTAVTSGTTLGVQSNTGSVAGPVLGLPSKTYTITEKGVAGTNLSSYSSTYQCINKTTGGVIAEGNGASGTFQMPAASPTGSSIVCTFTNTPIVPGTITLQKDLPDGRFLPNDQFNLSVTGGGLTAGNTGLTAGSETGIQNQQAAEMAGPVTATAKTVYTITESGTAGTDLANYTTTWKCIDKGTGTTIASGTGATGTVTAPTWGTTAVETLCTFTNTAKAQPIDVLIQKVGESSNSTWVPMDGSAWAVFNDSNGAPGAPLTSPQVAPVTSATGKFQLTGIKPGTYWLQETVAPEGFNLLAEPVQFTVATNGSVTIGQGDGGGVVTAGKDADSNSFVITVRDVPALELPESGGPGTLAFEIGGSVLVLASFLLLLSNQIRRRTTEVESV